MRHAPAKPAAQLRLEFRRRHARRVPPQCQLRLYFIIIHKLSLHILEMYAILHTIYIIYATLIEAAQ